MAALRAPEIRRVQETPRETSAAERFDRSEPPLPLRPVSRLVPCQGLIFGLAEPQNRTKPCGIRASERTAQPEDSQLTKH
ncbi:MAG: hypothetical protein DWQ34_08525 [Planctomycetota bacterium]|nr:MAG: hypothetical protein DWQ29_12365 [Planctomycetota bacterium]REJ94468.1 MAG: hypothetical protein DWQ34_08525 [Planctomycetota bacterium]REK22577.1 MAG: hypothetical protein DWQ41_19025 [Planctomycetota bacterium]REK36001.1 MAG: hypothetical protein DWQ45_09930 [Planctomycetota bacterium]